jgi:hypothetical protein
MGSKRYDSLIDMMYNGGELQITCRNPTCRAQLVVRLWRFQARIDKSGKRLSGSSFYSVSERMRCQWCGEKFPDVRATLKTR